MQAATRRAAGVSVARSCHVPCTIERGVIAYDVLEERMRQLEKWGEQSHPDMHEESAGEYDVSRSMFASFAERYKALNDYAAATDDGSLDWTGILLEEVYEALAEGDPAKLREELIQSAAVIFAWVEDIDTRGNGGD